MGRLLAVADVFVDRDILRFAEGESVSDLEAKIIAGFLTTKPPPLGKITKLLREGRFGEAANLAASTWAVQFREALTTTLKAQIQLSGDRAASKLAKDGFGVEELTTAASEQAVDPNLSPSFLDSRLQPHAFALVDPSFDPTDPRIDVWIGGRVDAIVGTLEDDAREAIVEAIERGAAEQLTDRQVAKVIGQHLGLDKRRAIAVENYRRFVYDFRARQDMERLIKRKPKGLRDRLQRGGFKRKEWRLIREHGAKRTLSDQRLDNMVRDYSDRLKKERALNIAQYEIILAQNRGKEFAWEEAQASGALLPGAKRKWVTRGDGRVCPICSPMSGRLADIGGVWHTSKGDVSTPNEVHSTCRCKEVLVAEPRLPRKRRYIGPRKRQKGKGKRR